MEKTKAHPVTVACAKRPGVHTEIREAEKWKGERMHGKQQLTFHNAKTVWIKGCNAELNEVTLGQNLRHRLSLY